VYWIGIGVDKIQPIPKNMIKGENENNFGYDEK
jgi:hypothetical protein